MYTTRQLINDAYRKSTVRGLGDTPDSDEVDVALQSLNDFLDEYTSKSFFAPSKKCIEMKVPRKGFITFSDNGARVVGSAVIEHDDEQPCFNATIHTSEEHNIDDERKVNIFLDGISIEDPLSVDVIDQFSFSVSGIPEGEGVGPGVYKGSWKYADEGEECIIDITEVPPVNIYQVVTMDGRILPEYQEQDFYARRGNDGDWYFYEKGRYPYPKLWVGGQRRVRIVYIDQVWHDLDLDTDLEGLPKSVLQVMKWRLASDLAAENGYENVAQRMEARFKSALMTYFRSQHNSASPMPDNSAPGYVGGRYNIYEDRGND